MNLWASFKAFLDSPIKFLYDPTNTTIAYQTREAVTKGMSKEEVTKALTAQGFKSGGIQDAVDNAVKIISNFINSIPIVLLVAVIILFFIYVFPIFRKK